MSVWSRFTSWLSGWPESKHRKSEREQGFLFAEEEKKTKENDKNIGKKKTRKQGNMQ